MRIYLEALENAANASENTELDFVRLDATGKDEDEVLNDLKSMLDPDKSYIIRKHYCKHEERQPCEVEILETQMIILFKLLISEECRQIQL